MMRMLVGSSGDTSQVTYDSSGIFFLMADGQNKSLRWSN